MRVFENCRGSQVPGAQVPFMKKRQKNTKKRERKNQKCVAFSLYSAKVYIRRTRKRRNKE